MIGIGVIGVGYWGQKHLDEFSHMPSRCSLEAASDLSPANLEKCKAFGVKKTYLDYHDLLADPAVKAVSICTNNETHFEVAKAALLAGKHVLVEKPLTLEVETSRELVELAKEKGLSLHVGHLYRFNAALIRLRAFIQSGGFGKIYFIKVQFTNHNGVVPGRSVLMDLAPHAVDICNFLTGRWAKSTVSFGYRFRRHDLEEVTFTESDLGDGMRMYGEFSWLLPDKKRQVYVSGANTCAVVDLGSQQLTIHEVITDKQNREGKIKSSRIEPVTPSNALGDELASFVSHCESSTSEPINSGEIGLRTVEALLSCKHIDQGKP